MTPIHPDAEVVALAREILDALIEAIDAGNVPRVESIIRGFADRPKVAEAMQLVRTVLVERRHEWSDLRRGGGA